MKQKRIITLLLCLLMMISVLPIGTTLAASSTVTIESQTNSAFDYLEYYDGGQWKDLNTPRHWIASTGEIVYCVEHASTNPHGETYTLTSPSNVFSSSTLSGLNSIFMYGYTNSTPSGFTADEARQATACAIRFWLTEQGEAESYTFTNRALNPGYIRAKSGYEHVLEWADELLYKARARQEMPHSVSFNPSTITLNTSSDGFAGQTNVQLVNINSGYQLNTNSLPAGASITGYTGSHSETLTITVPVSVAGQSFTLSAIGYDTRSVNNISAYIPSNGDLQKIFLCATGVQTVANATVNTIVPAYGRVKIVKAGEDGEALAGVKFGVFADANCADKIAELITGSDGMASSGDLTVGTVYIKELSTINPYIVSSQVKSVTIVTNTTSAVSFANTKAKGKICIEKTGNTLVCTQTEETEYGIVNFPGYIEEGLADAVFEVRNSAGTVVATLMTDTNGAAETGTLPLGNYTVQEKIAPNGYVVDSTLSTVTLAYKDQNTALVTATVRTENVLRTGVVKIRKITETFNDEAIDFFNILGEGYVFGLYTTQTIGNIPADALIEVLTTDDQGVAQTASALPYGNYYLMELTVPDETVNRLNEKLPLTIDSDLNTQYYDNPIYNTMFKAKIGVYKLDAADEARGLSGAIFEVSDMAGKLLDTITSSESGYAETKELPVGEYKVREVMPPTGFILSDRIKTITLTTEDKETAVFEMTNSSNSMQIHKYDSITKQPLSGARIQIFSSDGNLYAEAVTDADGAVKLSEIPAGEYTWKESVAPSGYAINAVIYSFTIDEYGKATGDVELADDPITLEITKMNNYINAPFAGITFSLQNNEGTVIKTKLTSGGYRIPAEDGTESFITDANGKAVFKYLNAGTYKLVETIPIGYIADVTTEIELTCEHDETNPCRVTVNNCPTGIKIIKTDAANGEPLTGAGFRIKIKDGLGFATLSFTKQKDGSYVYDERGTSIDLMVDENGEIFILALPIGTMWIEESVTPEGYFPISAQKVEVTNGAYATSSLVVTIKNSKFVKLGMDSDWWEFPTLVGGGLLLISAAVYLVMRNRKKRTARVSVLADVKANIMITLCLVIV